MSLKTGFVEKTAGINALLFLLFLLLGLLVFIPAAHAVKYPDWVFQDLPSAYTMQKNTFEVTGSWLVMDDTVDVFDVKKSEIGNSSLLSTSTGDYKGMKGLFNWGIVDRLTFLGHYQSAELGTAFGSSSTFKDIESTQELSTTSWGAALRFKILQEETRRPALSMEASYYGNRSDDAGFTFTEVNTGSITIPSGDNSLMLSGLSDSGYSLTILASKNRKGWVHSCFAGISSTSADSTLDLTIDTDILKTKIGQDFQVDETNWYLGYSLGIKVFERLPIFFSYKYIKVNSDTTSDNKLSGFLPDRYSDLENMDSNNENHVFSGKLVYWIAPNVNLTLDGTIYKNHFLGIVPHYNTPLTNRSFDYKYGYIGLGIGVYF